MSSDTGGDPSRLVRTARKGDHDTPHPLYVVWEITLECDLGCLHCGSRAGALRPKELTTAESFDLVDQMAELKAREVTLIGGEAYLRDDWHLIATYASKRGLAVSMTTGAKNLTAERVQMAVDAGLSTISISIDGLERTHDAQRGAKGSFRAAVEAAERVGNSPIRLATNTQINKLSMPELPALADLLNTIGSKAWQIQLTVAMGRAADHPDLLLQPYDLLELFPLLAWIKETRLDPNGIRLFPGNNIGYFGPYEQLLRYGGQRGSHWAGCAAGKFTLGIEADGKIKGCPSLPTAQYTGGNIRTRRLKDIIENTSQLSFLRERTRDDLWGYCKTCYYGDVCKAGCSWTSHCLLGKTGNNPYCIHRALDMERKGVREVVTKVEDAPGLPFDNGRFELVEQPMPQGEEHASILGKDLQEVVRLQAEKDQSAWTLPEIRSALQKRLVS